MIEFFIYSKSLQPPQITDILIAGQSAAWDIRALRDWRDWANFSFVDSGPLLEADLLVGWSHKPGFRRPNEIRDALESHDTQRISEMINLFELSSNTWSVDQPFRLDSHFEFESLDEAREEMGEVYANHIKQTQTKYTIFNCEDFRFLKVAAGIVAMLTQGLIEDPQSATFAFPPCNPSMLWDMSCFSFDEWSTLGRPVRHVHD